MSSVIRAALPNLPEIVGWDTAHLHRSAADWVRSAEEWENTFDGVHRGMLSPGGTPWEGPAADTAQERTFADLVKVRSLTNTLREAASIARRGADELDFLKRRALEAIDDARAAGLVVSDDLSVADASAFGDLRVGVVRQHWNTIAARALELQATDKEIAGKIRTAAERLGEHDFTEAPEDRTVQAVDFKEAPPPDPSYPMYDVIAEATDLDGNHIVMRRGYYDASSQRGFGWDKAYWRHGVVNPNVFEDLISHSRPITNDGAGTLVYEVPINRTHCTPGFLGLPSCNDTGESLTMRIVVNTTEGRPGVPDGGQKGLISMYPKEGGSGVVLLGPNWTWTPPWVNNNVPIN